MFLEICPWPAKGQRSREDPQECPIRKLWPPSGAPRHWTLQQHRKQPTEGTGAAARQWDQYPLTQCLIYAIIIYCCLVILLGHKSMLEYIYYHEKITSSCNSISDFYYFFISLERKSGMIHFMYRQSFTIMSVRCERQSYSKPTLHGPRSICHIYFIVLALTIKQTF